MFQVTSYCSKKCCNEEKCFLKKICKQLLLSLETSKRNTGRIEFMLKNQHKKLHRRYVLISKKKCHLFRIVLFGKPCDIRCIKSVPILRFFWSVHSRTFIWTEWMIYSVNLGIHSEYEKMGTRKTQNAKNYCSDIYGWLHIKFSWSLLTKNSKTLNNFLPKIPSQLVPFPKYPVLHWHWNDPTKLRHSALESQLFNVALLHSFTSR